MLSSSHGRNMPTNHRDVISKSDILVLRRPKSRKHPFIYVRVTVDDGSFFLLSQEKRSGFLKVSFYAKLRRMRNYIVDSLCS